MKLFRSKLRLLKSKKKQKTLDYYQESLNKSGRQQMEILIKKGLSIQWQNA